MTSPGVFGHDRISMWEDITRGWLQNFDRGGSVLLVKRHHAAAELIEVAAEVAGDAAAIFKNQVRIVTRAETAIEARIEPGETPPARVKKPWRMPLKEARFRASTVRKS